MEVSTRVRLNEGSVMWPEIPVQSSAGNILQQITTDNRVNKKYNIQYYFMKYNVIDHSINSVLYIRNWGCCHAQRRADAVCALTKEQHFSA